MHCAIFKNDKLVKQQKCVADGYAHANMYGGGSGYAFKSIQGYGKISVGIATEFLMDKNGNHLYDADGFNKQKSSSVMNNKDAIVRYRMPKTLKLLTDTQEQQYYNGTLKAQPYTCFIHKKKPTFEFCFSKPFMG